MIPNVLSYVNELNMKELPNHNIYYDSCFAFLVYLFFCFTDLTKHFENQCIKLTLRAKMVKNVTLYISPRRAPNKPGMAPHKIRCMTPCATGTHLGTRSTHSDHSFCKDSNPD